MPDLVTTAAQPRRFVILDVLRGLAAVAVVMEHFGQNAGGYEPPLAYLAVDLFFLISGFVLEPNYRSLANKGMCWTRIMVWRAKRLYPIYLLGFLLGFFALFARSPSVFIHVLPGLGFNAIGLPSPWTEGLRSNFFPENNPLWSIFFEFWVANLVLAVGWRALSDRVIAVILVASAALIVVGLFSLYSTRYGYSWLSIYVGLGRVGFSFFAGVLLARKRHLMPSIPLGGVVSILVTPLVFVVSLHKWPQHLLELTAVFALFPLVVWMATGRKSSGSWFSRFLGDTSYALYAIHFPLLLLVLEFLPRFRGILAEVVFVTLVAALAYAVAFVDLLLRQRRKGDNLAAAPLRAGPPSDGHVLQPVLHSGHSVDGHLGKEEASALIGGVAVAQPVVEHGRLTGAAERRESQNAGHGI